MMALPLHDRRIVVTRPAVQAAGLAQMIADAGGDAVLFPLLEIGPADDPLPLQRAVERLGDYALAVFVSPNAIDYALPAMLAAGSWPVSLQAAVIGPSSAAQLARHGVRNVVAPALRYDSEALLELPALQGPAISGKRVLLLRGNGGRELLAQTLGARGAQVDAVCCYQRRAPADATPIAELLAAGRLDALTLSSSEGLRNLLDLLDVRARERLRTLPVFVPHQRIAQLADASGLRRVVLTGPADAGIIVSLCAYAWPDHA